CARSSSRALGSTSSARPATGTPSSPRWSVSVPTWCSWIWSCPAVAGSPPSGASATARPTRASASSPASPPTPRSSRPFRRGRPAVRAGAAGYLLKDVEPSGLEAVIRLVHEGEALLDPQIAGRVMEQVAHPPPSGDVASLTPREREVLELLGRGLSNRELADTL